jgi:hypothetical protein
VEIYVGSITNSLVLTSVSPGIYKVESENVLGITPESFTDCSYLVEAAWIAIRKDTEMQNYYETSR